jgi:hypothetical protein
MSKLKQQHFPHDVNASRDEKILAMRSDWGCAGYGLYWEIIEYLFSQGGSVKLNTGKSIALAIGEDVRRVNRFIKDCIEIYHLFDADRSHFWSNRLRSEIEAIKDKTEKARESARQRYHGQGSKSPSNKQLLDSSKESEGCERNTDAERTQSKGNAIIEEKIREENIREPRTLSRGEFSNIILSDEELGTCLDRYGENLTIKAIEKLSRKKKAKGYTYESDYAALLDWVFPEVEKQDGNKHPAFIPKIVPSVLDEERARGNA